MSRVAVVVMNREGSPEATAASGVWGQVQPHWQHDPLIDPREGLDLLLGLEDGLGRVQKVDRRGDKLPDGFLDSSKKILTPLWVRDPAVGAVTR
jgi:hypothetical protein